jgi:hypothetical protein
VTAAAVEQFGRALSLLRAAQAAAVSPMDSAARINSALSAGPVGPVPGASLAAPLDLLSVGSCRLSVGAECIGSTRDTMGGTALGCGCDFPTGGRGVEARSALLLYYPFRSAKFIPIASALGISGSHEGTPTAPTPARVLISKKKEGGRGCE